MNDLEALMFASRKTYENKRIVQACRVDRRIDSLRGYEETIAQWVFTVGSQVRVDSRTEKENIVAFKKPASAVDWLKSLVVEFQPSLNFGWLKPKFVEVKLPQDIHHHDTYYNVLPTPQEYGDRNWMEYQRFTRQNIPLYSEMDLLEAVPPTRQEVHEQRIEASKMAAYLAMFGSRP